MEMGFLDALTMVSLRVGEAEEAFLEEIAILVNIFAYRLQDLAHSLFLVPERKANVLEAMSVGNSSNTVFAPPESSRSSVFVGEI